MTFRVLDGNHRVAALAWRDKNHNGNEDTIITVAVHRTLADDVLRIIADRAYFRFVGFCWDMTLWRLFCALNFYTHISPQITGNIEYAM